MIDLVRLSAFQVKSVRIFLDNQSNRFKYIIILIVDSSFVRNEPARKSGGFLKNFIKKSFGKGRLKKDRKSRHDSGTTGVSDTSSGNNFIENPVRLPTSQHPPDIWLSKNQTGIQKPVPRKPPRSRTRSKSGSGIQHSVFSKRL